MSKDSRVEAWLRDFSAYWMKRVREDEACNFDGTEWCSIEIFTNWLSQDMCAKAAGGDV